MLIVLTYMSVHARLYWISIKVKWKLTVTLSEKAAIEVYAPRCDF